MDEKILVTGATGRVGKHLVDALIKQGNKVRALVKNGTVENENVEIFYGDILDKESLRKATEGVDVIYHLAAIVDYLAPRETLFNVNVVGTKNLLEFKKLKKFIYLSSTAAMGKKLRDVPANESTPAHPTDFYGQTKLDAEKLVKEAGGVVIRSADVIGPGFTEGFDYVISGIDSGKMPVIGDGKNFIQWIHIDDLIQALLLAKENGKPGEIYIVTGKEVRTMNDCMGLLAKYLGVDPPKKHVSKIMAKTMASYKSLKSKLKKGKPVALGEYIEKMTANRSFDISKAKKDLGFEPKIDYEQSAKEMVEEYRKSHQKQENVPEKQGEEQAQGKD
jgi:nucleoside-diphosphate-sugar epimerase